MYKGKRKRIRKKDVTSVTTYEWPDARNIVEFIVSDINDAVRIVDVGAIDGSMGDTLEMTVYLTLIDEAGAIVMDHAPFVLLPADRTYFTIEEEAELPATGRTI